MLKVSHSRTPGASAGVGPERFYIGMVLENFLHDIPLNTLAFAVNDAKQIDPFFEARLDISHENFFGVSRLKSMKI